MEPNDYALLNDNSGSKISGHGTAVFTMNRCYVLVHNALHIRSLRASIYSTQRHCTQPGCAYYDDDTVGNLLLFATMVIDVESTTDNIFSFRPIGRALRDRKLDYGNPHLSSARLTKNPLSLESVDSLI